MDKPYNQNAVRVCASSVPISSSMRCVRIRQRSEVFPAHSDTTSEGVQSVTSTPAVLSLSAITPPM